MLQPDPASAGLARRFVRDALQATGASADLVDRVELLTSEIVTNLVVHVGAPGELALETSPGVLRVRVRDHSDRRPVMGPGARDATGGRGLVIVAAVSDTWGVDEFPGDGKAVWFELALGDAGRRAVYERPANAPSRSPDAFGRRRGDPPWRPRR